ncbi:hypothetical protein ACLB2K_049619 [Fragaria x ananassa]
MVSYSPWLMVPNQHHSEEVEEKHIEQSFLNVSTNRVHTLQLPKDACVERKTICGFSLGWLIFFDNQNSSLTLLNPFTGHQINNLPQLPGNGTVHKAILSADPYPLRLQNYGNHYDDILFETEEALVAVGELGKFVVCDPPVCDERVPPSFFHGKKVYLVTTHVDVFMLVSVSGTSYYFGHETYDDELKRFEVYRYDEGKRCSTQNLKEFTIFLGHNHSLAVRNAPGFRANCIYFTDDDEGKVENSGVFSLEDGEAERMQWLMPAGSTKNCETINLGSISRDVLVI